MLILLLLLLLLLPHIARAAEPRPVPRTILALYDEAEETRLKLTRIHTMAEMPLNHLGLVVRYWNVNRGLPDRTAYPGLRGVLTWFTSDPFDDPHAYVDWLEAAMGQGARLVSLGRTGVATAHDGRRMPQALLNRYLALLGLRDDDGYSDLTYRSKPVVADPFMMGYERALGGVLPGYPLLRRTDAAVTAHLVMRRNDDPATDSVLVSTGPRGGLVVEEYARYFDPEFLRKQWLFDPFRFFRLAFATDDLPKPDVTTLSGRRLYFSHVDGDGWRNVTEVQPYAKQKLLSAEVIRKEAVEPYPDLPVTIAPIVGDIDPRWKGTAQSLDAARTLLALPQVEAGSHTWTHPFQWSFFKDYGPEKEEAFKASAAGAAGKAAGLLDRLLPGRVRDSYETVGETAEAAPADPAAPDIGRYAVPRAYLQTPFDLWQETAGSLDAIGALVPGKPAKLLQWSGDTSPFEAAVADTRRAGARNMNGGDTRYDAEYPSYTSVSPIGIAVGTQRQIYAAGSNENTYTDLWSNRFYGFQNLARTIRNTETPIRVKPFNIYYHAYSGQKLASINALRKNLELARASEIAPVTATTYAAIADAFYTTQLVPDGERRWRVRDHGALSTLRFDRALFTAVDFARSAGVIGQRWHQGSLYVALDPDMAEPVVALNDVERADIDPPAARPYLVEGRWRLAGLTYEGEGWRVRAQGFGAGAMRWRVPSPGRYTVTAERDGETLWRGEAEAGADGLLSVTVDARAETPLTVRVARTGS